MHKSNIHFDWWVSIVCRLKQVLLLQFICIKFFSLSRKKPLSPITHISQSRTMSSKPFGDLIGSIDEGTSSARFLLFKAGTAEIVCYHQLELTHSTPHEGWVEQDPMKIVRLVNECIEKTVEKLIALGGQANVSNMKKSQCVGQL